MKQASSYCSSRNTRKELILHENVNIPICTSNFAEIRQKDYYYIDKTGLIEELLRTPSTKVTLITRPRRFGKTLGMSMMAEFLISKVSSSLFEGLSIYKK